MREALAVHYSHLCEEVERLGLPLDQLLGWIIVAQDATQSAVAEQSRIQEWAAVMTERIVGLDELIRGVQEQPAKGLLRVMYMNLESGGRINLRVSVHDGHAA